MGNAELLDVVHDRAVVLTILGLQVAFFCSRPGDLGAVHTACEGVAGSYATNEPGMHIELIARAGPGAVDPPKLEVDGQRLFLDGEGVTGVADAILRRARCTLDGGYFSNPRTLFTAIIEPIVLFLAARNGRIPLHAAAVDFGGLAVLLAGCSGSGKSSLALAADRAGETVLSEDMVFVRQDPALAFWGWDDRAHLFPADAFGIRGPVRTRNGKRKIAVALTRTSHSVARYDACLCLLERGTHVALDRISPEEARVRFDRPEPGFDLIAEQVVRLEHRLSERGAWLLTLSADPAEAIALLQREVPRLRATKIG